MRLALTGLVAGSAAMCAAMGSFASPPIANELMLPLSGSITTYANPDDKAGGVPTVQRGQVLGVACAAVGRKADVRVVLSLAPDEAPVGYTGVLATDQTIAGGAVHIRVPDLPDLAQHTVRVRVFVMDAKGTHTCDVGRVRIV